MDRSRQAGCEPLRATRHLVPSGINRARSRPAACLISLALSDQPETFFPSSIVLVSYKFIYCVLYLFQPNPILCVVIPRDNQTDVQAGWPEEGTILGLPVH
jgi:hypothetical protein